MISSLVSKFGYGLQLDRDSWEHEDPLPVGLVHNAWRHASPVFEDVGRPGRDSRHAEVPLRDLGRFQQSRRVHALDTALYAFARLTPHDQLSAEGLGQCGEGAIVRRRTKPAGAEHVSHVVVGQLPADLVDDLLRSVPDRCDTLDRKTQQPQAFGEPVGVCVQREPADQLVADRHDAGHCHAGNI